MLTWFREAWTAVPYPRYLVNSVGYVGIGVPLYVLVSALTAYPLAVMQFRGRTFFFFMFLSTMFLPGELMLVPRFIVVSHLGMADTYQGVILPGILSAFGILLLRQAFAGTGLLPDAILWREKAAFSDAVGHGLVEQLKAYAEKKYNDAEFCKRAKQFEHCPPLNKEALLYRELFESHYPERATWIPDYWLPNKEWANCNVTDPSARVLPNYGLSGV